MRATNMYTERKDYEYKEGNVAVHAKIIVYIICGGAWCSVYMRAYRKCHHLNHRREYNFGVSMV